MPRMKDPKKGKVISLESHRDLSDREVDLVLEGARRAYRKIAARSSGMAGGGQDIPAHMIHPKERGSCDRLSSDGASCSPGDQRRGETDGSAIEDGFMDALLDVMIRRFDREMPAMAHESVKDVRNVLVSVMILLDHLVLGTRCAECEGIPDAKEVLEALSRIPTDYIVRSLEYDSDLAKTLSWLAQASPYPSVRECALERLEHARSLLLEYN